MAKKYTKPTTEQEIEQLRKDIVQELAHWKNLRKYGCQDPFWPDGNLPEEYYLPTPPVVDNNYLAPKGEYFDRRKKSIERMPGDKVTTKKQADVDLRIGALF